MKALAKSLLAIGLAGCASDPGYEYRPSPEVVASEPQLRSVSPPEAPGQTVADLQACADQYARRLSVDSASVVYPRNHVRILVSHKLQLRRLLWHPSRLLRSA